MATELENNLPILYSFRRCPYAMRARLALYTARISHEHREIDLKNKPAEMLEISPKGTVPVLHLPDGKLLEESLDIMKWALQRPVLSAEENQWIQENDTSFKKALDRYKYPERYNLENGLEFRHHCENFLAKLEAHLNPFLFARKPGLADMALFPFVRQCAMVDTSWFDTLAYPILKNWINSFVTSPLFENIMIKYLTWFPGVEVTKINFSK